MASKKESQWNVALVSEQYAPDMSSTAQLFEELMKELQDQGIQTSVCAMTPGYIKGIPKVSHREIRQGIPVHRFPRLPFARTNRKGEAINWLWGTLCLTILAWRVPRHIPLLVGTNPPMAHIVGAIMKILKRQRFIALFYDLHPELSCSVGLLKEGSLVDRIWRQINRQALRFADVAICLGPHMEKAVKKRYEHAPTTIVHNWCDPKTVHYMDKAESQFAKKHDLLDKFVVLFSGNMGWRQRLEILIDVAEKLQDLPVRFVFIGEGVKKKKLQQTAEERGLNNVLFFPYQPRDMMKHSLAAADLTVVSHEREAIGFGVPCKIYAYMASGRALLGLASKPCELIDLIKEAKCGWYFNEDTDQDAIVAQIKKLMSDPKQYQQAGKRSLKFFEQNFSLKIIAGQYAEIIKQQCKKNTSTSVRARLFSKDDQQHKTSLRQDLQPAKELNEKSFSVT